jgi:YegS/Rv2252/BmrU family lipid kinase
VTRAFVVVNPAAGAGRTERLWPRLRDAMARLGLDFEWAPTTASGDGIALGRDAARRGFSPVVAVGGDGTLNEIVNGVTDDGGRSLAGAAAILTGRGRDACRNFGIAADPLAAAARVAQGTDVTFDLGVAEWANGRRRYFAIAAGAGFDAAVARRAQTWRMRGTLPYLAAVLATVHRHRPADAVLEMDGVAEPPTPITAVVAANGRWFGGGMKIAPQADPADGALDVVVLGALGRLELLRWLPTIYPGTHVRHPRVRVRRARRLRVSGGALPTHLDGEPAAATPITLAIEPGALRLRVPRVA